MPCCGQVTPAPSRRARAGNGRPAGDTVPRTVSFQYTGRTGLTVVGSVTGRQYRFDGTGATLPVDVRDQRAVAAVPNLRRVP
jgi:hypothetical protein